jgi:alpha-methylacyl-CoA racemase
MAGPLSHIRVLDLSRVLAGPWAGQNMADLGAEVIKVERPGGEEMRNHGPHVGGESVPFALLNRGKTNLVLNLKDPAARARLRPILARADVLVEQFRPGTMQRLGLGYDAVAKINPRIVYCSISGYGQHGPRAGEAGHDLNYIAQTGLLAQQPGPADRPVVPPALIADIGGGTFPAVINILLALRQRDLTGKGCYLDIAMADAMFTFAWTGLAAGFGTKHFPGAGETPLTGGSPRYQIYPTADGELVACAALEQKFWLAFVAAIDLAPEFIDDTRDPQASRMAVAERIAARTAQEWRPILAAADCCATIVASLADAVRDPHFVGRGLFAHGMTGPGGEAMPALPLPIAPCFRALPDANATATPIETLAATMLPRA